MVIPQLRIFTNSFQIVFLEVINVYVLVVGHFPDFFYKIIIFFNHYKLPRVQKLKVVKYECFP